MIIPDAPTFEMTKQSPFGTGEHTMTIHMPFDRYVNWLRAGPDRPMIQDAFPDLPADEREFILTGTTPEEWAKFMAPPEEDELGSNPDEL